MQRLRWLCISRVRVRFLSRVPAESASAILLGSPFGPKGTFSAVGRGEEVMREYIRHQEVKDKRIDQLDFRANQPPLGGP
jgi:hypothetical protein